MKRIFLPLILLFSLSAHAVQDCSGPRFGVTVLSPKSLQAINQYEYFDIYPVISQFGWQFEKEFFSTSEGPAGVTAFVLLMGGTDQGVFIPSVSWVTGLRSPKGFDVVAGPNFTLNKIGMAFSIGANKRKGDMFFPMNTAIVLSKSGIRVSFLLGFTTIHRKHGF